MFNKVISLILILLLSFSFTACSASESSAISEKNTDASSEISSNNENSGNKWDYSYVPKNEPKELTLDDAKVRLVSFFKDDKNEHPYLLLAYYGPQDDIGMHFCTPDGKAMEKVENPYFTKFDNGWRLLQSEDLPSDIKLEDISIKITDYSKSDKPSKLFSDFGEALSKEELKEIGINFIGDNFFNFTHSNRQSASKSRAEFTVYFTFYNRVSYSSSENPFDISDFEFFAKNGTPLYEFAEGYDYSVDFYIDRSDKVKGITVTFEVNDGNKNSERNDDFCMYLRTLDVYMLYTAEDGTVTKVENLLFK